MIIYSIGYEKITIEDLLGTMNEKKIDRIIDVRSIPYSRRPDKHVFNRNRLLITLGNRYLWKGDILGGKYGPASGEGILWLLESSPLARYLLMCLEDNPLYCHRLYDIGRRLLDRGIDVIHIYRGIEKAQSTYKEETNAG